MSAPGDGGPAFPTVPVAVEARLGGMTLRDYFAAKALQGLLANEGACRDITEEAEEKGVQFGRIVVSNAYKFADEMLLERGGR